MIEPEGVNLHAVNVIYLHARRPVIRTNWYRQVDIFRVPLLYRSNEILHCYVVSNNTS